MPKLFGEAGQEPNFAGYFSVTPADGNGWNQVFRQYIQPPTAGKMLRPASLIGSAGGVVQPRTSGPTRAEAARAGEGREGGRGARVRRAIDSFPAPSFGN
jgi:hypothetical protein